MYAIVEIAGQQFKVEAGNEIFVQRLADAKGADVEFKKVLLVANDADVKVGAPYVDGAVVKATVLEDDVKADEERRRKLPEGKRTRPGWCGRCTDHEHVLQRQGEVEAEEQLEQHRW